MNRVRAILYLLILALTIVSCLSSFGESPAGERLERIQKSTQYKNGAFTNNPVVPSIKDGMFWEMVSRQLFGSEIRVPQGPIPVVSPALKDRHTPEPGLRAIWLGHSGVLLELDGVRILTDPVFAARVSPVGWAGPERFFPSPVSLQDLPPVDAVVISHDHYDHLDLSTVQFLATRDTVYFVPLGIGAHLEAWGFPAEQIRELDWGEEGSVKNVRFVSTPAVHYSGRGIFTGNETLWTSWSIIGPRHRVFYSGDTGYSEHFAKIGQVHGPFDLTLMKIGAYDHTWDLIHMNPEQAVQAHVDVRGKFLFPVHWATFNLAIHSWDEPIKRTLKAAEKTPATIIAPPPGEEVSIPPTRTPVPWWEHVAVKKE